MEPRDPDTAEMPSKAVACVEPLAIDGLGRPSYRPYCISKRVLRNNFGIFPIKPRPVVAPGVARNRYGRQFGATTGRGLIIAIQDC